MVEGIVNCFPKESHVVFFFEACTDQSKPNFLKVAEELLQDYAWSWGESPTHILEHGVHGWLIDRFMESDCDVLVVPHDDNKFLDPQVTTHIEKVVEHYGEDLGWITARDGHGFAYECMISSPFSSSDIARAKVQIGEFVPRMMLNTGPVVYTRRLIEKIGKPDMTYEGWYWWTDYSLKAHQAGLVNGVLGMDCLHEKFGWIQNNHGLFDGGLVARDLKRLNDRWAPLLGRTPV
jgi:hypothetical protein